MFSKFFDNMGPLPHHVHHRDRHAARVGQRGKPEMYFFPSQLNNHGGEFPFTFFGFNPETQKDEVKQCLENFSKGDNNWKSPKTVAEMLRQCAAGQGNLMLNLAPKGNGSIPEAWEHCVETVGAWLGKNGESIYTDRKFAFNLRQGGDDFPGEWTHHGRFSASARAFYWHIRNWPGNPLRLTGVECEVIDVAELATGRPFAFRQEGNLLIVENVPETMPDDMPAVFRFRTKDPPRLYNCGGCNIPKTAHCRYDPLPSDLPNLL